MARLNLKAKYMAYKKRAAKPRRAKRAPRRGRKMTKPRMEYATARQTLQLPDDDANTVYTLDQIRLSQFDRMTAIARNYQYFRITKVEMKFKPFADTFAPGTGGTVVNQSVPYLYTLVNKGNVLNTASFNALRDAGAKPRRFDEKTLTVSWKPAVLLGIQDYSSVITPVSTTVFNMKKVSPWLATSLNAGQRSATWAASTVDHTGILYGVEQDLAGTTGQLPFGVEITAYFEFKGPLNAPGVGTEVEPVTKELIAKEEVKPPVE